MNINDKWILWIVANSEQKIEVKTNSYILYFE